MLKTRIIPCLDIKDGRVVKGVNFVDLKDAGNPVEVAANYQQQGADELCFLDITASVEKRDVIFDIVRQVAGQCFMPLSVGGGVRTLKQIKQLMEAGADKVAINTAAIENPNLIEAASKKFGAQAIIAALDVKQIEKNKWELFTHGGRKASGLDGVAYAKKLVALGAGEILLTSMDRDGTKKGFDCALTAAIAKACPVPVIASGGAGKLEHFGEVVLQGKASAVLAASVFHFGTFSIAQVKKALAQQNIPVRT
jgi:cyclase